MPDVSTNPSIVRTHAAASAAEGFAAAGSKFVITGIEYQTFRPHFMSAASSEKSGYFSRSKWKRAGREPLPVLRPVLCVAKAWTTFSPKDGDLVLGYSQFNNYLVTSQKYHKDAGAMGCWPVFSHSETQLLRKAETKIASSMVRKNVDACEVWEAGSHKSSSGVRNSENELTTIELNSSRNQSFSSLYLCPLIPSSYDGEINTPEDAKSFQQHKLRQSSSRTRLIATQQQAEPPAKGTHRNIQVYFPEGFDWSAFPELAPYRSSVLWFAHNLHERRFVNADGYIYGPDEFIVIKSEFARNIDPNFRYAIKLLLDFNIIERDFYERGTKSYGYRFLDPQLRYATRRRIPLGDAALARRIDQHRKKQVSTRTDRWLRSNLLKIGLAEIDEQFLQQVAQYSLSEHGGRRKDKLDCYRYVLERIVRKEHLWTSDDQGRRYSLITNLKRELRSLLRVDGQQLHQIDIANSQLTFLALKMRDEGVDCAEFLSLCEQGQLYEHVAKHAAKTRSAVKKAITQSALFSTNDAACQKSSIKRTFDRLFPEVAAYLAKVKSGPGGNSKLAKELQFAEADLIVDRVCSRLRREGQVDFISPIHDCLMFLPKDAAVVKSVMADEFSKLDIQPLLQVKPL